VFFFFFGATLEGIELYLLFITRLIEQKSLRSCYLMSWNPPSFTTSDPFI